MTAFDRLRRFFSLGLAFLGFLRRPVFENPNPRPLPFCNEKGRAAMVFPSVCSRSCLPSFEKGGAGGGFLPSFEKGGAGGGFLPSFEKGGAGGGFFSAGRLLSFAWVQDASKLQAALAFAFLVGLGGCSAGPRDRASHQATSPSDAPSKRSRRLEETKLSLLSTARSHHQRAGIFLKQKDGPKALSEIDAILSLPWPEGWNLGRDAILDAWGRKALILLSLQRSQEALLVLETILQKTKALAPSYYLANLHHVQGQILERLDRPKDALEAYQRSIALNKAVIEAALREKEGRHR